MERGSVRSPFFVALQIWLPNFIFKKLPGNDTHMIDSITNKYENNLFLIMCGSIRQLKINYIRMKHLA